MGPYAGAEYTLTLCPLQSLLKHIYHGQPTLQRHNTQKSKQIFSGKELLGLSPNFYIHEFVSDLYIPTTGLPLLLKEYMWTDPGNV
jgi:hypothetical protein